MLDAVRQECPLVNLLPSHTSRWWPIVEDIFHSDQCRALQRTMLAGCVAHEEYKVISIDGTFRVCLSVLGQEPFNAGKAVREEAPFHGRESVNRVITARGRTGAVLAMFPAPGEGSEDIKLGLKKYLGIEALQQVMYAVTDAPSHKLFAALKSIMPNLLALSLDPVHLAMHFESASSRKKTAASATLRRCMAKFSRACPNHSAAKPWGPHFTNDPAPLTAAEEALRNQILDGSMVETKARRLLKQSEDVTLFAARKDFIEHLAAISAAFGQEAVKKSEEGRPLYKLLWAATQPDRLEYLFNNLRLRACLSTTENLLLPTGTTSNESLHAEINGWFRQTQGLHGSTLELKLHILTLAKQLSHNVALYSPTARQMPSAHVLARRLGAGIWTEEAWNAWAGRGEKPGLPIEQRRKQEAAKVKQFLAKKPAVKKRPSTNMHRTPFNLPRSKGVKRAGVHRRREPQRGQ